MTLTLADLALKATFLLAVGAFAAYLARKNAALKRQIWVAVFLAIPLCLPARLLVPTKAHLVAVQTPLPSTPIPNGSGWEAWILWAWLVGFTAVAFYGAGCWRALVRLRSRSDLVEALNETDLPSLLRQAGVGGPLELRVSNHALPSSALTWGWRKPVVVLPQDAARWEPSRMRAVLLHELAHIRRRDSAVQLLVLAVCSALWFNPFVWLCARAYRAAAEAVADEAVLLAGVRPTDYASILLSLISECAPMRREAPLGASMLGRSGIEERIRAVIEVRPERAARPNQGLSIAGLVGLLLCVLASFQVAIAQQKPIPDIFKGKSKEWIQGYQYGRRYMRENGAPPSPMTADERYQLEKRLKAAQEMERRLNGG